MNVRDLIDRRARIVTEAQGIYERAETEKRSLTADESTQVDRMLADADKLAGDIERARKVEALGAEMGESRGRQTRETETTTNRHVAELRSYLLGQSNPGMGGMVFKLPTETRALSVGSQAGGGYTTQPEPLASLEVALKQFADMRTAAKVIRTATGSSLPIPTLDNTAAKATIIPENGNVGTMDLTFSQATLGAYKWSSGVQLVSIELLQDSAVNVGELIGQSIGQMFARGQNEKFTVGSGTGEPEGITTNAIAGVTQAALADSVTVDNLTDLVHSVDRAYRASGQWMLSDQSLAVIRKLKDTAGRPLFWSDANSLASGAPATILGYQFIINPDMPSLSVASKNAILFGDFASGYIVRDVLDISVVRLSERYIDSGQVGFVGLMRSDGKPINAGGSPVKAFKTAAA